MIAQAEAFRQGMRRLAASVTILTTRLPTGERIGMTATAVCSVSGDPPTLLCCVNRANATREAFSASTMFAVNVLAAGDEELATRFATRMEASERFEKGAWTTHVTGSPILETAVATFDCRVVQIIEVATHSIFIGEVVAVRIRGEHVKPLIYAHGGYGKFAGAAPSLQDLMWTPDWQVYD